MKTYQIINLTMPEYVRPVKVVFFPKVLLVPVVGIPQIIDFDWSTNEFNKYYKCGSFKNRYDINLSYMSTKGAKPNYFVNKLFQLKNNELVYGDCYIMLVNGDRTDITIDDINFLFIDREMFALSVMEQKLIEDILEKAKSFKTDTPAYNDYLKYSQRFYDIIKASRHTLQYDDVFLYDVINSRKLTETFLAIMNIDPEKREEEIEYEEDPLVSSLAILV